MSSKLNIQDYLESGFPKEGLLSSNHASFKDEANAAHYDDSFKQSLGKSTTAFNEKAIGAVLITGKPSGIIAIDFDNGNAEAHFNKLLSKYTDKELADFTKCKVLTKKGSHYYFKLAENEDIPFVSNKEYGIDILGSRNGSYGGQLDFAPFYGKNGFYYKRDAKFKTFEQLTEMPEHIREVVKELIKLSNVSQKKERSKSIYDETEIVSSMDIETCVKFRRLPAVMNRFCSVIEAHYERASKGLVDTGLTAYELDLDNMLENFMSYLSETNATNLAIFIGKEIEYDVSKLPNFKKSKGKYEPSRNVTLASTVSSFIGLPLIDRGIIERLYDNIQALTNYYDDTDLAVDRDRWLDKYYDAYSETKSALRESFEAAATTIDSIKNSPATEFEVDENAEQMSPSVYEKTNEDILSLYAAFRQINPYAIPYYDAETDRVVVRFTNGQETITCVKSVANKLFKRIFDKEVKFSKIPLMTQVCDTKNLDILLKTKSGFLVINTFNPNKHLREYIRLEGKHLDSVTYDDLESRCPYIHKVFKNVTEGSKNASAYNHLIQYSKALVDRRVLPYMLVLADRGQGGTGKTLTKEFFSKLLGYESVGGLSDGDLASDNAFLAKQTKHKLLVTLDETQGSQTESNNYTRNLKRMIANKTFTAQAKNRNSETYAVTWNTIATTNYIRPLLFENGQLSRRVSYVISGDTKLKDIEGFDANDDFLDYLESEIPEFIRFLAALEYNENDLKPQVPAVIAEYVAGEQSSNADIVAKQLINLTTKSVDDDDYKDAEAFFESEFNLDDNFMGDILKDAVREIRNMSEVRVSSRFLRALLGKENKSLYGNVVSALINLGAVHKMARCVAISKGNKGVVKLWYPCLTIQRNDSEEIKFTEKALV